MTKVCHFSSAHGADDVRIFRKQCRALARAGYDVHLVAGRDPSTRRADGVTIHPLEGARRGRIGRILLSGVDMLRQLRRLDADIYHFHDPELLPVGWRLKTLGKTVIYDAHEDLPADIREKAWIARPLRQPVAGLATAIERFVARRLDAVVTATPHIRDRIAMFQPRTTDIRNMPDMTELIRASGSKSEIPFADRDTVAYVGAISVDRGLLGMVDAAELAGCTLTLAGHFSYPAEKAMAMRRPGWRRVREAGRLDRADVWDLLGSAYAGLVILRRTDAYEVSLPIKLFEYMAAGIPVVASNFGLWQEIVEQSGCGICVDPDDANAIAEALDQLRRDPCLARRMGEQGCKSVMTMHNWALEEGKLLRLYTNLSLGSVSAD